MFCSILTGYHYYHKNLYENRNVFKKHKILHTQRLHEDRNIIFNYKVRIGYTEKEV